MDKKYVDIHIVHACNEYVIREVSNVMLEYRQGFIRINYLVPNIPNVNKLIVPSMEGLKIYID